MKTVNLKWVESTLMVGSDSLGNAMVLGMSPEREPEWRGMRPADLMLLSAASCSTYDVAKILTKQKQPVDSIEVKVSAEQLQEPPYNFTKMHFHFTLKGSLDPDKVARAIKLSDEKYCSVINTLRPSVDISIDFEIIQ
jgi:putative redox protein